MNARIEPTPDGKGSIGIIELNGREFMALGEYITDAYATAYLKEGGILTTWNGEPIGTFRIVSSWPVRSFVTDRMYQIEGTIGGRVYTGRSAGFGMAWNGRAKAKKK